MWITVNNTDFKPSEIERINPPFNIGNYQFFRDNNGQLCYGEEDLIIHLENI
ncbi:hypothetical protein NCCP28_05880 [Niallia sp. NCCP-28]|nr:hypothetical protein NCCP28_05880 [Niallia sp. NCCP-28]